MTALLATRDGGGVGELPHFAARAAVPRRRESGIVIPLFADVRCWRVEPRSLTVPGRAVAACEVLGRLVTAA